MDNSQYNEYMLRKLDYLRLINNILIGGGNIASLESSSDNLDNSVSSDNLDNSVSSDNLDSSVSSDNLDNSVSSDNLDNSVSSDNLDNSVSSYKSDIQQSNITNMSDMVDFIFNLLKRYGDYSQAMINDLVIYNDEEQTIKNLKSKQLEFGLEENLYNDESNKRRADSKIKFIKHNIKHYKKITSFLDFGGGSCDIAYYVGQFLKLKKDKTYCVDIDQWIGFKWERKKEITFMNSMDDLPDNSVDLILASYVLHHIEDSEIKNIINNFYRILSKHGHIILVEHDSPDKDFDKLLDIQHMIYDTVVAQIVEYSKFKDTYYSNYKPIDEWNKLFKGFANQRIIKTNKFDRTFFGIYKKY